MNTKKPVIDRENEPLFLRVLSGDRSVQGDPKAKNNTLKQEWDQFSPSRKRVLKTVSGAILATLAVNAGFGESTTAETELVRSNSPWDMSVNAGNALNEIDGSKYEPYLNIPQNEKLFFDSLFRKGQ